MGTRRRINRRPAILVSPEFIKLSKEDRDLLRKPWYDDTYGYLVPNGSKKNRMQLHRIVLSRMLGYLPTRWELTDHKNGDRFDCRRKNLRLATPKQNAENKTVIAVNNRSGYRGVFWRKDTERWTAQVGHNGKKIRVGCFDTAKEAAEAASKKRKALGFTERELS